MHTVEATWDALNEAAEACGNLRHTLIYTPKRPEPGEVSETKALIATLDDYLERHGLHPDSFWDEMYAIISIRSGEICSA